MRTPYTKGLTASYDKLKKSDIVGIYYQVSTIAGALMSIVQSENKEFQKIMLAQAIESTLALDAIVAKKMQTGFK